MIYTKRVEEAINLAIQAHETDKKQKRKGKDIPYIVHPLSVGMIIAKAGGDEDVVIAGILHDTIEDSAEEKKITKEIIKEKFGENIMELVLSVTEEEKDAPWEDRKAQALAHIEHFSNDSVLLKSADVVSNVTEIYLDYQTTGDKTFDRFNAKKEKTLENYSNVARALLRKWTESPLADDLKNILENLEEMREIK
ncbi:MAG: HD domain-containing protein [Minisyncoccia bacterium]